MDEQNQEANWSYTGNTQEDTYVGAEVGENTGVPMPEIPTVTWTASEYIAHEKSPAWFAGLFAGSAVLVVLVYLITRDMIASVAVFVACIALGVYAGRKPEVKRFEVGEHGIKVAEKSYQYAEFRSFSVVEEGVIDSVWLKPLKKVSPAVVMYFSPEDEEKIVNVLSNFLPYEERELDAIDRMSKRMRF